MQPGDIVENFTLPDQDGNPVSLTDFAGKTVVLFFYPKADTPGCTIEACEFRDNFQKFDRAKELQDKGVVILGISRDTVKAQKKFQQKYDLPYTLLADADQEIVKHFDLVKPKTMYGKLVSGVERTTYVIGPDQRLVHIFNKVKPEGHAEEVLALLKKG
jgi:peroxiredoxin Q/BCP